MKFLPFDNFQIQSHLSIDEVTQRLDSIVQVRKIFSLVWFFTTFEKPYSGNVSPGRFEITRNITYQNSFIPRITGVFSNDYHGTLVDVKMRMSVIVNIFMCIWLGSLFIATMLTLVQAAKFALVTTGMFVAGYTLMILAYRYEANKSKRFLIKLLGDPNRISEIDAW